VYGRYKIIPLHAEIIGQCEELGFDFLGSIIWQKKTTMNTTGGATVMGSYPYPPNGLVELDYEFILLFKKPGAGPKVAKEIKEASKLTKEEWKEYFAGHWHFGGARQSGHEARFPAELPRRLIKMFTFAGETVLDPFLGSGTTVKAALELGRSAVGYEINEDFLAIIREKFGLKDRLPFEERLHWVRRAETGVHPAPADYAPRLKDAEAAMGKAGQVYTPQDLYRVVQIVEAHTIRLDTGQLVRFGGVEIAKPAEALRYLQERLLGKHVFLRDARPGDGPTSPLTARVCLKNKLCINKYLIKAGLAVAEAGSAATASLLRSGPAASGR
jgi:hypothetical protein